MAIGIGVFVTDKQRQRPFAQSSPGDIEPGRGSAAGWQQEKWDQGPEKEYDAHLRNLQQYICELLIKNQQLRWLLESATNHQFEEPADG
jgi:hypothetical protein